MTPKFEGEEVTIAGQPFTMPALNFRALEKFAPFIEDELSAGVSMKQLPQIRAIIASALRRNYPDLDDDFFLDNLDMRNAPQLLVSIMSNSGVKRLGETKASAVNGGLLKTGATSTSISSPVSPDGLGNTSLIL